MPAPCSSSSLKSPLFVNPASIPRISSRSNYQSFRFLSKIQPNARPAKNILPFSGKNLEFSRNGRLLLCLNGGGGADTKSDDDGDGDVNEAEKLAIARSTMPERFRYLTKEVPDPPPRWPWFVALAFVIYAWRAVLFELANWKNLVLSILGFVGYLVKLALALIFHFLGDPITSSIELIETSIYTVRAFYSGIVAYAPVKELTVIIVLASAVFAIAEAAAPNSVSSQPHMLTISGLIGYAVVSGYISEPVFWTLLFVLYSFSRIVRKRDDITSALPVAAIMAAVGEPWVRILVMASYLALAIFHHSKKVVEGKEETSALATEWKLPLPLLAAALAIGIRLAAKWAGYRHLTWKII